MGTRIATATLGQSVPPEVVPDLILTAGRAPSVHNTQPWQFTRTAEGALELRADPNRQLHASDPSGRELIISCGAALFGLRLAIRGLGHEPAVSLLPTPGDPLLLARVALGPAMGLRPDERRMLVALRRRHTQRDTFDEEPVPSAVVAALQRHAEAERTELVLLRSSADRQLLATLVTAAEGVHQRQPRLRADVLDWTRPPGSHARDGVPATSFVRRPSNPALGDLANRDFALGRPWGTRPAADRAEPHRAAVKIAVLTTARDRPVDWLSAGQALHRVTLIAATRWVFASLHTQALELDSSRASVCRDLHLNGYPQMLLRFGHAGTSVTTPRRPLNEVFQGG